MTTEANIRRLAFIRYLYSLAEEQAERPEPTCAVALLLFHDAAELFLQLSSEELNTGATRPEFMEYFTLLNEKLKPGHLSSQESMRRLNKARVALKHHGTLPSRLDLDSFRATAAEFFRANTRLVFRLDLEDVSLVRLIGYEPARSCMLQADHEIEAGNRTRALEQIALAFEHLITHEERKQGTSQYPPIFSLSRSDLEDVSSRELPRYLEGLEALVKRLQADVRWLSLGLDLRRVRRFRQLTPEAVVAPSGVSDVWTVDLSQTSNQDVDFCYNFVIEAALRLETQP